MKRYSKYCSAVMHEKISCDPGNRRNNQYYLPIKKCNGFADCDNKADENFDECKDMGCGQTLEVTGPHEDINGIYRMGQDKYHEDRPYWYREEPESFYLYFSKDHAMWKFNPQLGGNYWRSMGRIHGTGAHWGHCPSGLLFTRPEGRKWFDDPSIKITCVGCDGQTTPKPSTTKQTTTTKTITKQTTAKSTTTQPVTTTRQTNKPVNGCQVPVGRDSCVSLSDYCNFKVTEITDSNNDGSRATVQCRQHYRLNIPYMKDPFIYGRISTYAYCRCLNGSCQWKFNKGNVQCTHCPAETLQARNGKKQKFVEWDNGIAIYYPVLIDMRSTDGWHVALDFNAELSGGSTSSLHLTEETRISSEKN